MIDCSQDKKKALIKKIPGGMKRSMEERKTGEDRRIGKEKPDDVYSVITQMGQEILPELIRLRRDFHRHPETGWLEMRTSAIIAKELTALGYEVLTGKAVCKEGTRVSVPAKEELEAHYQRISGELEDLPEGLSSGRAADFLTGEMKAGYTGVVGILRCGAGPVVALRFDIDALPMTEAADGQHRPYR